MNTTATLSPEQILSFEEKICQLKKLFEELQSPSEKYELMINLGKQLSHFDTQYKTEDHLVSGCQSRLYLHAQNKEGLLFFSGASESLISAGLAALLIFIYSGESAETILRNPPHFLQSLGIYASLSPARAHGIANIYLKMKMISLKNL